MWWKYYVPMYENGKVGLVATILGMGEREEKREGRGVEFNYDIL
jgi:hypothetical protein